MENKQKYIYKRILEGLTGSPERGVFLRPKNWSEPKIGLKACWHEEQLKVRFRHKPKIIELYLYDGDLENHLEKIYKAICKIKQKGIEAVIHQPERYLGKPMTIASTNNKITKTAEKGYERLYELSREYDLLRFIMHPYSSNLNKKDIKEVYKTLNKNRFLENLMRHPVWHDKILLENATVGFFKRHRDLKEIADKTEIKLCIDLCHLYLVYQDNNKLEQVLRELGNRIAYYHIVDTRGQIHDSLELGQGRIDFNRILKYITQGIIEVDCKNQVTADEMIRSYYTYKEYLLKEKQKEKIPIIINNITKNLAPGARFFKGRLWQSLS